MKNKLLFCFLFVLTTIYATGQNWDGYSSVKTRQMEHLDRGLVAVNTSSGVFLSWRFLGNDDRNIAFNVYRDNILLNEEPLSSATNYIDESGSLSNMYSIGIVEPETFLETERTEEVSVWKENYKKIQLVRPAATATATYTPNDCSVADLDGDGEYEIIVKWEPSNSKDNSQSGVTDKVYLDAYKMDGTFLWRIDLGVNIRAGAHYTQFMVYDLDGDGLAEIACKTAPGTKDGKGNFISKGPAASANHSADYRNSGGYVLSGPEYLTVFSGLTGEEVSTVSYNPPRGTVSSWGDNYGNRVDRFLACIAYLDGKKPSLIMCRGYYTRSTLAAYDLINGELVERWFHDSNTANQGAYGQGNHNLSVADVDGDGFDEIIYGSCVINHDGTMKSRTGLGHADAIHVSDLDPERPGYEVWINTENTNQPNHALYDPDSGEIIWSSPGKSADNGRGLAADIDPNYPGFEMWSSSEAGIYDCKGNKISDNKPSINFRIYWDGDLQDELLDGNKLDKWDWETKTISRMETFNGSAINGTKANPCLSADLFGDWREEVIYYDDNDPSLMIFTTTVPTEHRLYTLMHDPVYRLGIAWQNVAYNQPPHLGFYIGGGLDDIPYPNMTTPIAVDVPDLKVNLFTLESILAEAKDFYENSDEGIDLFQYPANAFTELQSAITEADGFLNEVDRDASMKNGQAEINEAALNLRNVVNTFKAAQILTYVDFNPDKYYNIYSYGYDGASATDANKDMTKKFLSTSGSSLIHLEGTTDNKESGLSDPVRKKPEAQWQVIVTDASAGLVSIKNRKTGEYAQISDAMSSSEAEVCFHYRKNDNGKLGFSLQRSKDNSTCLQITANAVGATSYADRARMRWVFDEIDDVDGTTGLSNTNVHKAAVSVEYVDILGRKVPKGTKGVIIERTTYSDKSIRTKKIINTH